LALKSLQNDKYNAVASVVEIFQVSSIHEHNPYGAAPLDNPIRLPNENIARKLNAKRQGQNYFNSNSTELGKLYKIF